MYNTNNPKYKHLIKREGKIILTQEVLDQDYNNYNEKSKKGKAIAIIISTVLLSIIIILFIFCIIRYYIKKRNGSSNTDISKFSIIVLSGLAIILIIFLVISCCIKVDEPYTFTELYIKSSTYIRRSSGSTSSKSNKSNTSNKSETYYYYLIMENNEKIEVNKDIYYKFKDFNYSGIFYAGKTESGVIFSLYSSNDYELEIKN